MSVPIPEQRILALRSGNLCAFPDCKNSLIREDTNGESVITGEIAHIVGDSRQGPRGRSQLSDEERDRAENLIYFCESCHKLVDQYPQIYSVAVLRQMKRDHEKRILQATQNRTSTAPPQRITEQLHSTLLRVAALPATVFAAPCAFVEGQEKEVASRLHFPNSREECIPFLLREKQLYSFHDPRREGGPFSEVLDCRKVSEIPVLSFAADPEGSRRLTTLLNSSLRHFLGIRNLGYDKHHQRYYFQVNAPGEEREEPYHTLTGRRSSRNVVWQPKKKATGEPRNYWLHLAAAFRFIQLAEREWGFSIRLERHVTTNGTTPFPSEDVGRKVTRLKAKMFNDIYLSEVHFWRDFLSAGKPRFILSYGSQSCIVESELVSSQVEWAGIPDDSREFTNQEFTDDLFSLAELQSAWESRRNDLDLEDEDEESQ